MRTLSALTTILLASSLTACVVAPYQPPYQAQQPVVRAPVQPVEQGRVATIERVRTQEAAPSSGAGPLLGGIAGAVIGHQIGGGFGRSAATVLGGFGGAIVGNHIENSQRPPGPVQESLQVTVQADDGSTRYFSVPGTTDLRVGERVRMANGQLYR